MGGACGAGPVRALRRDRFGTAKIGVELEERDTGHGRHRGDLEGRVALISGGAGGIGAATARALAGRGCRIVVFDLPKAAPEKIADEISESVGGADVWPVAGSVTDPDALRRLVAVVVDRWGSLDIAVNSAGVPDPRKPVAEIDDEEWALVLGTHLTGTFNVCRAVVPVMTAAGWGRIVNITSSAAWAPGPGIAPYAAAKAGITGFTRSLAAEVGRFGVTANCVAPGLTATPRVVAGDADRLADRAERLGVVVGPRPATPDEVAAGISYLCSASAAFTTGTTLHINGGAYVS